MARAREGGPIYITTLLLSHPPTPSPSLQARSWPAREKAAASKLTLALRHYDRAIAAAAEGPSTRMQVVAVVEEVVEEVVEKVVES